jgi:cytochrome bd ubiquinol oxidase subunit II
MNAMAFAIIAFMLTAYVLLDGYDLGVAAIASIVGKTDGERAGAMQSIGPFWNGNEVWLIAAGGVLFMLFPKAYASSFSGFYLPFMVVLWMLMFRGIAMELRERYASPMWHQFWDVAFTLSSTLLILLFGVALGNLLRGVPLDARGYFQGSFAFLLNPYALLVGIFGVVALAQHGAAFLAMRVDGPLGARSVGLLTKLWWVALALYLGVSAATAMLRGMPAQPWLYVLPVISIAALIALRVWARAGRPSAAFAASCVFLASLLIEAAGTLFPYLIPAFPASAGGLSVYDVSVTAPSLGLAVAIALGGIVMVVIYGAFVWRAMAGKVHVE